MNFEKICHGCFKEKPDGAAFCPYCGFDESEEQPFLALPLGTLLNGRYMTGKVLGVGGFGITYLGYDLTLEIQVAIKEYMPSGLVTRHSDKYNVTLTGRGQEDYQNGMERFLEEARILAKLQNTPNVVSVQNYFKENNTAYFVMEYIDGMSLKEYLASQGGKIPCDQALTILMPVMQALTKVHAMNLTHRDISPDNISITSKGESKLLDFGAARFSLGDEKSVSVILKHGYAPEEQYSSRGKQGPWTDVYAMGATLYRCLTGELPPDSIARVHNDTLKKPSELGVFLPPNVDRAIVKALSVKAEDRYPTMEAFIAELSGNSQPSFQQRTAAMPTGQTAGTGVTMPAGQSAGAGKTMPTGQTAGAGVTMPAGQTAGAGVTMPAGQSAGAGVTMPAGQTAGAGMTVPAGMNDSNVPLSMRTVGTPGIQGKSGKKIGVIVAIVLAVVVVIGGLLLIVPKFGESDGPLITDVAEQEPKGMDKVELKNKTQEDYLNATFGVPEGYEEEETETDYYRFVSPDKKSDMELGYFVMDDTFPVYTISDVEEHTDEYVQNYFLDKDEEGKEYEIISSGYREIGGHKAYLILYSTADGEDAVREYLAAFIKCKNSSIGCYNFIGSYPQGDKKAQAEIFAAANSVRGNGEVTSTRKLFYDPTVPFQFIYREGDAECTIETRSERQVRMVVAYEDSATQVDIQSAPKSDELSKEIWLDGITDGLIQQGYAPLYDGERLEIERGGITWAVDGYSYTTADGETAYMDCFCGEVGDYVIMVLGVTLSQEALDDDETMWYVTSSIRPWQ